MKHFKEHRRQRVRVRTYEAMQEFEDHLRTVQEALNGVDDLPMDAEAGHLHHARRSISDQANARDNVSDTSSTLNRTIKSHSQSEMLRSSPGPDVDPRCDLRPPSPLRVYDYGAISTKPRSALAQRSKEAAEPTRPGYRQSTAGFYCPGAEFRQGPYGFSMLEPILLPVRSWEPCKTTPSRWPKGGSDIRSATTEARDCRPRRSRTAGALSSDGVRRRSTALRTTDKRNEESLVETVRFDTGTIDGRRDAMLESSMSAPSLAPAAPAGCSFLLLEADEDAPRAKQVASKILFGVESALRSSRGNLQKLFAAVNRGSAGILEPEEFLDGLIRLGVVQEGELSPESVMEAMACVDPHFDGCIRYSMLERAVAAARGVHLQRSRDAERLAKRQVKKLTNSYHETLPIDVVKVERQPKSLFDFERAFERFRKQQKELLAHHGEFTSN